MKQIIFVLFITVITIACKSESVTPGLETSNTDIIMMDVNEVIAELTNDTTITEIEKQDLLFVREEEKMAGDVYRKYYELYELRPFGNIEVSELRHTEAIKVLLDQFGMDDPAKDEGEFANDDLQELYDNLMSSGSESIENAISNGILIEEKDIFDLKEIISHTTNVDIKTVYEYLLMGSKNHLTAFMRLANNYDIEYVPQYLTMAEIEDIISTTNPGLHGKKHFRNRGKK